MVGGIVSPVSDGYGKQGLVLAKHRIAMAKLALQSSNWVTVDEWESRQPDWTETVVTMRYKIKFTATLELASLEKYNSNTFTYIAPFKTIVTKCFTNKWTNKRKQESNQIQDHSRQRKMKQQK